MSYYPIYTYDGQTIVMDTSESQPQLHDYDYIQSQSYLPNYDYIQSHQYYSIYTCDSQPIIINHWEY